MEKSVKIYLATWEFEMEETRTTTIPFVVKDVITLQIEKELLERDQFTVNKALKNIGTTGYNKLLVNPKTKLPKVTKITFDKSIGDSNQSYEEIRSGILNARIEGATQVDIFNGEPRPDKCPVWTQLLKDEMQKPYMKELQQFLIEERKHKKIYPASVDVFNAFKLTHYNEVRVVIIGQDPYHTPNTAHGLAFSSLGKTTPPSLANIFKEVKNEYIDATFETNDLSCWAKQGVLLLNTVLTVEEGRASAHKDKGWEQYVGQVIKALIEKGKVVFVAWGKHAQDILQANDVYPFTEYKFQSAHPSPYSANQGFFGNNHFRLINSYLTENPINWSTK